MIRAGLSIPRTLTRWILTACSFGSMSEGIERLKIRGRPKLRPQDFAIDDRLYVAFDRDDIDPDTSQLIPERIRFPDFSCNWSRFSEPADVRLRPNGHPTMAAIHLPSRLLDTRNWRLRCMTPLLKRTMKTTLTWKCESFGLASQFILNRRVDANRAVRDVRTSEWSIAKT